VAASCETALEGFLNKLPLKFQCLDHERSPMRGRVWEPICILKGVC
jgi:hypothetical protein